MIADMTNTTRIAGYGASIEHDGSTVRIIGGKLQAGIWKTDSIVIPIADIQKVDYRSASMMVNGSMSFHATRPANEYATPRHDGKPTMIPENSLVIHWRKKDEAAFAALRNEIEANVTAAKS